MGEHKMVSVTSDLGPLFAQVMTQVHQRITKDGGSGGPVVFTERNKPGDQKDTLILQHERASSLGRHLLSLSVDSYHCLVFFALSCASKNTFSRGKGLLIYWAVRGGSREHSHSLSVTSRPSLNVNAASPDWPPPPAGPRAAKCCA